MMAQYLNNIRQLQLPSTPEDLLGKTSALRDAQGNVINTISGLSNPPLPNASDAIQSLKGKLPTELGDKAAQKYKELQDKFNNLKKLPQKIKRPAEFKQKELPIPKKFKKAELEKIKGLQGKIGNLKSQAMGIADKAKDAAAKAQNSVKQLQSQAQNIGQTAQSQIGNIQNQLPKI